MKSKDRHLNVPIAAKLLEQVKAEADRRGLKMYALVAQALTELLAKKQERAA